MAERRSQCRLPLRLAVSHLHGFENALLDERCTNLEVEVHDAMGVQPVQPRRHIQRHLLSPASQQQRLVLQGSLTHRHEDANSYLGYAGFPLVLLADMQPAAEVLHRLQVCAATCWKADQKKCGRAFR